MKLLYKFFKHLTPSPSSKERGYEARSAMFVSHQTPPLLIYMFNFYAVYFFVFSVADAPSAYADTIFTYVKMIFAYMKMIFAYAKIASRYAHAFFTYTKTPSAYANAFSKYLKTASVYADGASAYIDAPDFCRKLVLRYKNFHLHWAFKPNTGQKHSIV